MRLFNINAGLLLAQLSTLKARAASAIPFAPTDPVIPLEDGSGPNGIYTVMEKWCDHLSWNASDTEMYGTIENWDTTLVTDMRSLVYFHCPGHAFEFNDDISRWNTGAVTNMEGMFQDSNSFNVDISNWDVSRVTSMARMFANANNYDPHNDCEFNQDISRWDVSKVEAMTGMFECPQGVAKFNQNISRWNVSRATDMTSMLQNTEGFGYKLCWNLGEQCATNALFYDSGGCIDPTCGNAPKDPELYCASEAREAIRPI